MTDPSKNLFSNGETVAAIKLTDFLEWAAQLGNVDFPLSLPPIQRGFVWKPRQIADLWDSLLRQMPIGSLMLQRHEGGMSIGIRPSNREAKSSRPGFHLLDGQQRTLAMLLGWPDAPQDPDRRLWVDLGEGGKNGAEFMLRVTTRNQPFGFQPGTHEMLSRSDRKKAFERHCQKRPEDQHTQFHEFDLDRTRPWKAGEEKSPFVQLREVWNVVRNEGADKWEETVATRTDGCELAQSAKGRLRELCEALQKLNNAQIALVCVPKLDVPKEKELEDPAHHPLTMLFERIATGGTRLSSEDLLFSIIKQVYPESHNFVYEIHKSVGYLMTAPDYVMTAFRVACAMPDPRHPDKPTHADNANPSAKEFHRYLKDESLLGTEQTPGRLRKLIMAPDENPLALSFKKLKELLCYRDKSVNGERDIGIPMAMFPRLSRSLVQVLVFWLVRFYDLDSGDPDPKVLEASRCELVRFALFWILVNPTAKQAYAASEAAFEIIRNHSAGEPFPAQEVYSGITKGGEDRDPLFVPIVDPDTLSSALVLAPSSKLRAMEERMNGTHEEANGLRDLFEHFWRHKELLLWLQRDYVEKEFHDYKYLARNDDSEDNVPYDFDHLVPQADWSTDIRNARIKDEKVKKAFQWYRAWIGNAIGNFRVVGSAENRGRRDTPLGKMLDEPPKIEEWKRDFAFAPTNDELKWWLTASPASDAEKNCTWDEKRIESFQAAIEHRTVALYRQYFNEAGFHEWLDGDSS